MQPGSCGFSCRVEARRRDKRQAIIEIGDSQCELIHELARNLKQVTLKDLFAPHTRNPVYKAAETAGCHLACPVPVAILKAAEVALQLALPRESSMVFEQPGEKDTT